MNILLTRAVSQLDKVIVYLQARQHIAHLFPCLSFQAISQWQAHLPTLHAQPFIDKIIFISPTAVSMSMEHLLAKNIVRKAKQCIAIGPATAKALASFGQPVSFMPTAGFNSDALLQHKDMQNVSGETIAIVKGQGGRKYLQDVLTQRGAKCIPLDFYQRVKPDFSTLPEHDIDLIILSSATAMQYLQEGLVEHYLAEWSAIPLLVTSQRLATKARELGFKKAIFIAQNATQDAIIKTLDNIFLAKG